ncbi:MAG: 16S rRNA (adenine(1518)-N(6)/adenine(1519)-N(6))-dimethyltransferase RsmA [Patescibacteria group bacterium]|jgi:16S rRNA (adenine1518-N6/adenine1519-N6)-dimethyltransferase
MFESKEKLIQYLKENHLYTNKLLGQNFLVDENALTKIIEAGDIEPADTIIEIGPGLGVLTERLVEKANKVISIELDQKLAELLSQNSNLKSQIEISKLEILNANALDFDLSKLQAESYKLIANIPYYITSKILEKFLTAEKKPKTIVLLVQKEVAERICAPSGAMSVLSVAVQAYGEPEIVDIVSAASFFPAPKVDSAILKVKGINWKVKSITEKDFFQVVKIGFAARRKTLLNNLSAALRLDKGTILNILKSVKLNENVRAQELSIAEWQTLAINVKLKISNDK